MRFSYELNLWANVTGVQSRGGDRKSEGAKIDVENSTTVPSQNEHADSLGVTSRTVENWEDSLRVVLFEHREALQPNHPE